MSGVLKARIFKVFTTMCVLTVLLLVFGVASAFAAPPALSSATYDILTGKLVFTGTNFVSITGGSNDIDTRKIMLSDSNNRVYTLKSSGKVDIESASLATIQVSAKDMAGAAQVFDKVGTKSSASTNYNVMLLPGWNGPTSTADLNSNPVTVANVISLTNATYDCTKGELVITGANLDTNSFIVPKAITISNSADRAYTLVDTKNTKPTSSTSATLAMGTKDLAALDALFSANGTSDVKSNSYNITVAAGWCGASSIANVTAHSITVFNYAVPVATVAANVSVPVGTNVTTAKSDKIGYLYLVPATTNTTSATVYDLNLLVTAKVASKTQVKVASSAVTLPTKGLVLGADTKDYKAVAVDRAGNLSSLSTNIVTINNLPAPSLAVTAVAGSVYHTTTLTVTPGAGNTIQYAVSTSVYTAPKIGASVTGLTTYTAGSNIAGVDATTKKYLNVYEVDSNGRVVKFKCLTLTAKQIKAS